MKLNPITEKERVVWLKFRIAMTGWLIIGAFVILAIVQELTR